MITTNSLGKRIAKTDEQIATFWRWFGGSKAVDEKDRPLVLYHGTNRSFDAFRSGDPIFLTEQRDIAAQYARLRLTDYGEGSERVISVYAAMTRPLVVDAKGAMWDQVAFEGHEWFTDEIAEQARKRGFDGALLVNVQDAVNSSESLNIYAVFNPSQVKSTTDNRGTFDPSDPVITNPRVSLRPAPRLTRRARRQLRRGAAVEMEHTRSRKAARIIAAHHLAESPRYYQALARMERRLHINPLLGNTGLEFQQNAARKLLVLAIRHAGQNPDAADDLIAEAFRFAKQHWQQHHNRILPHREWAQLRLEATLQLAKLVASGALHP